ncbi:hypothetical protein [Hymenobacter sp. UYCo722]|uniref:hypothetical protein n=1 Tax=Hymenobacter sp. UYCo722 TaxID=3156335 RepID=UPI00339B96BA
MDKLQFQAMQRATAAHTARQEGISALGEVVKWAIGKLGEHGTELQVENELKRLEPEIQRRRPKGGGVLVRIGLMEWAAPDFMGDRAQRFMDIAIVGTGMDAGTVLRQYEQMDHLLAGPPDGWRRRDSYMWVTSPEHHDEIKPLTLD